MGITCAKPVSMLPLLRLLVGIMSATPVSLSPLLRDFFGFNICLHETVNAKALVPCSSCRFSSLHWGLSGEGTLVLATPTQLSRVRIKQQSSAVLLQAQKIICDHSFVLCVNRMEKIVAVRHSHFFKVIIASLASGSAELTRHRLSRDVCGTDPRELMFKLLLVKVNSFFLPLSGCLHTMRFCNSPHSRWLSFSWSSSRELKLLHLNSYHGNNWLPPILPSS